MIDLLDRYNKSRRTRYIHNIRENWVLFREKLNDFARSGAISVLRAPTVLYIAPTDDCNLRCMHCYQMMNRSSCYMTLELFEDVLKQAYEMGVLEVTFEGGEPFLHPNFIDFLSLTKQYNMVIDILTNATCITPSLADSVGHIIDSRLDGIQVSLDGDEQGHDYIRGKGAYIKAMRGLACLQHVTANIRVNCVYTGNDVATYYRLCDDILKHTQVRIVHFAPVIRQGNGRFVQFVDPKLEIEKHISQFIALKEYYADRLVISGTFVHDSNLYTHLKTKGIVMKQNGCHGCCAARTKLYIDAQHRVYPCAFLRSDYYIPYSLRENSLREIWRNGWPDLIQEQTKRSKRVNLGNEIFICPAMEDFDDVL